MLAEAVRRHQAEIVVPKYSQRRNIVNSGRSKSACWNYKVMGSQRRYLEGLIDDMDDADDEY